MTHSLVVENLGWAALTFVIANSFIWRSMGTPGGPIDRMVRYGSLLFYIAFDIWMISAHLGLFGIVSTSQERVTWAWVAAGWTAAGIAPAIVLFRRYRGQRARVAVDPRPAPPKKPRRAWQYVWWPLSYLFASLVCSDVILFGSDFSASLSSWSARWSSPAGVVRLVAGHAIVFAFGYAYSLVLSGGLINSLRRSFNQDWQLGRKWQYLLLAGPYLLPALAAGVLYPGLWAGVATHVATLFAGWRWTREPPASTLGTLRNFQNLRREKKFNSLGVLPRGERVIAARQGSIVSARAGGPPPGPGGTATGFGLLQGKATLGFSRSVLILSGKKGPTRFDLAEITGIWLALPATLEVSIGVNPAVSVQWKDRARNGIEEFARRLAYERSTRLVSARPAPGRSGRC